MYGSGGLFGKSRTTSASQSVPGIWTMEDQIQAARENLWPGPVPTWSISSTGSVDYIRVNGSSVAVSLENLKTAMNDVSFQNRVRDNTHDFQLANPSGSSFSFSWNNFNISTYDRIYLRLQRVSTFNVNWTVSGTGLTETSGSVSFISTEFTIPLTAANGSGTFETTNSNYGVVIQDMVLGNSSGTILYVPWV